MDETSLRSSIGIDAQGIIIGPENMKSAGLLYERGQTGPYEKITFTRFDLAWLTGK